VNGPTRMPVTRDLEPRVELQFFKNVVDVTLHSVYCKIQPRCDLLVAESFGDKLDDLPLPACHPDRPEWVSFAGLGSMSRNRGEGG
jgi:hypothetical protein